MPRKTASYEVLFERRVLFGVTVLHPISFIFWLVAVSTVNWWVINGGLGIYVEKYNHYFLQLHSGLWRYCNTFYVNRTVVVKPTPYLTNTSDIDQVVKNESYVYNRPIIISKS